jgi:chemotaxis signal transduction protein
MIHTSEVLLFTLDGINFSVPVEFVSKVILAQDVIFLNSPTGIVRGIFNYRGKPVVLIAPERRFSKEVSEIAPSQYFIIADIDGLFVAMTADIISGVEVLDEKGIKNIKELTPGVMEMEFYFKPEGMYYIYNIKNLISESERADIINSLQNA